MQQVTDGQVHELVYEVASQVVGRFFEHLKWETDDDQYDYHGATEMLADQIANELSPKYHDVTTTNEANDVIEEMYNKSRTELVRLLNLAGGTVQFGPGDVQPLTDQRLGQSEAWDHWISKIEEDDRGE